MVANILDSAPSLYKTFHSRAITTYEDYGDFIDTRTETKWHIDNIKVTGYENFSEDIIVSQDRTETKWHVDNIELNYEESAESDITEDTIADTTEEIAEEEVVAEETDIEDEATEETDEPASR